MSTGWAIAWVIWLATTAATFGLMEWLSGRETLSANLRRWLGVDPRKPWRAIAVPVFVIAVAVLATWLVPHIVG